MGSRLCRSTEDGSTHTDSAAIRDLSVGGVQIRADSFESLEDVADCLLKQEQEIVQVVLKKSKESWKNKELFEMVEEYFGEYVRAAEFCTGLGECLKAAREGHLLMTHAFERLDSSATSDSYQSTLKEVARFKNPFNKDFSDMLQSIHRQQISIFKNLRVRKRKLKKKLKYIFAWRKVCIITFLALLGAVLVGSVVAAAVSAPPVASALAAATSIPIGSMGEWVNTLWKSYEDVLKGQRRVFRAMQVGTYVLIKDLDHIRVMVDKLCIEIENFTKNIAMAEPAALKLAIGEMKRNMEVFVKCIDDLGAQSDICKRDIKRARNVILGRIIKHPGN